MGRSLGISAPPANITASCKLIISSVEISTPTLIFVWKITPSSDSWLILLSICDLSSLKSGIP